MPLRPIRLYPEAILRKKARRIGPRELPSAGLVEEMFAVMLAANGIGLAANQIGLDISLAVIDLSQGRDPRGKWVLVNPEIVHQSGESLEREGCLSLPGLSAEVRRAETVKVRAQDWAGEDFVVESHGLFAQALQHEIGHLNGELYIDHLPQAQRALLDGKLKKMRRAAKR